jgi:hypothetical protein
MSNPTTPFGWQMPTPTDLVTDLPADFEVFGQAVATSMGDLLGGTSGQILAKNSNTDMDFVWIANDQGDITGITASSPLTGGGTSGAVTVGILDGTTSNKGAVQLSDSTSSTSTTLAGTANAVKNAFDAGGMTLLSTTTISGASTTISSISQSYRNLFVQIVGMTNATADGVFSCKINNTTSIYGNSIQGTTVANLTNSTLTSGISLARANNQSAYTMIINNYTNPLSTTFLNVSLYGLGLDTSGGFYSGTNINAGWAGGAAVTSLVFANSGGNFTAGTVLVYGVK